MFRAVTAPEAGGTGAVHADETLCPDGSVNPRAQPLTAVVPALVIVTAAVSPVFQGFTVYETRHPPTGGFDGELDADGDDDDDTDGDGDDGVIDGDGLGPPD